MGLMTSVLDLYSEGKAKWKQGWWGHTGAAHGFVPTTCIMGAIGLVVHMRMNVETDPKGQEAFIYHTWVGHEPTVMTWRDKKELTAFYNVLKEQYPDDKWTGRNWRERIDRIINWNDQTCKSEEELLRVVEKTAIKLAEQV